jgi:hypothetical protein
MKIHDLSDVSDQLWRRFRPPALKRPFGSFSCWGEDRYNYELPDIECQPHNREKHYSLHDGGSSLFFQPNMYTYVQKNRDEKEWGTVAEPHDDFSEEDEEEPEEHYGLYSELTIVDTALNFADIWDTDVGKKEVLDE